MSPVQLSRCGSSGYGVGTGHGSELGEVLLLRRLLESGKCVVNALEEQYPDKEKCDHVWTTVQTKAGPIRFCQRCRGDERRQGSKGPGWD